MSPNSYSIAVLLIILSIISVLAALVVVVFYFRYRRFRKQLLSTLIFMLSVLDIFCWGNIIITTSYFLRNQENIARFSPGFCAFLACFWNFSEFCNFGVTLIISISLYMALMRNIDPIKYKKQMFTSVFTISLILSIIPFFIEGNSDIVHEGLEHMSYGPVDDVKCWITHRGLRIYLFYVPLWLVCIVNIAVLVIFFKGLHLRFYADLHNQYQIRFELFPAIMMGCYFMGSIRRIWEMVENCDDCTPSALEFIMYSTMPLQGLFNTIVYGMFEEFIRLRIIAFFKCNFQAITDLDESEEQNESAELPLI